MIHYRLAALATAALFSLNVASAAACAVYIQPKLTDARQADAVIVGHVTQDVRDVSPERQAMLEALRARDPQAARDLRHETPKDRARLTVEVDHRISGAAPDIITVYWYRMTNNGPPVDVSGSYVFALRKVPPQTSRDGVGSYAVMQGICSGALVFQRGSTEGNAIREMFGLSPEALEQPSSPQRSAMPSPLLIVYGLLTTAAAAIGLVAIWLRSRRR